MNVTNLKNIACKHFKITMTQLDGSGRSINVVYARAAITSVLHSKGFLAVEIADILGRQRTTILHHLRTFEDRIKYDHDFRSMYNEFIKEVE